MNRWNIRLVEEEEEEEEVSLVDLQMLKVVENLYCFIFKNVGRPCD